MCIYFRVNPSFFNKKTDKREGIETLTKNKEERRRGLSLGKEELKMAKE
jgi:hypothetical protein